MENSIFDKKSRLSDKVLSFLIQLSTLISVGLLIVIIGFILIRGIPSFNFGYLVNTTEHILVYKKGALPGKTNLSYEELGFKIIKRNNR